MSQDVMTTSEKRYFLFDVWKNPPRVAAHGTDDRGREFQLVLTPANARFLSQELIAFADALDRDDDDATPEPETEG